MLTIHDLDSTLLCDITQTEYTIRNSLGLDEPNPTDFSCAIKMRSAASFGINTFDVDDTK